MGTMGGRAEAFSRDAHKICKRIRTLFPSFSKKKKLAFSKQIFFGESDRIHASTKNLSFFPQAHNNYFLQY